MITCPLKIKVARSCGNQRILPEPRLFNGQQANSQVEHNCRKKPPKGRAACTIDNQIGLPTAPMIFRNSASVNAFKVSVEMFPSAPAESANLAHASSLGNSEIKTASYRPMVKY